MTISPYLKRIREKVGHDFLLLPSVSGIVFDEEGRMLLVRSADLDTWVTPGGMIEPGQTPADAVVQELWEETGLRVEPVRILGVYAGHDEMTVRYPNGDIAGYVAIFFECKTLGGTLTLEPGETTGIGFYSQRDMEGIPLSPWARRILPGLFERDRPPYFDPPRE